jgi:hypothetical protein
VEEPSVSAEAKKNWLFLKLTSTKTLNTEPRSLLSLLESELVSRRLHSVSDDELLSVLTYSVACSPQANY